MNNMKLKNAFIMQIQLSVIESTLNLIPVTGKTYSKTFLSFNFI
jgi:hypothetical protein